MNKSNLNDLIETDLQVLERIGRNVKYLREKMNLSQKDLAEEVGLARQTILHIEKGNLECSVTYFLKLARALKVDPNDLAYREYYKSV